MKLAKFHAFVLTGLLASLPATDAFAALYYNSYGKFTVEVLPASTIFTDSCSFNGNGLTLRGQSVSGETTDSNGTVYVRFTADPGFVFTGTFLGFGSTPWTNASFNPSGYWHSGGWSVPGGVYQGAPSFAGGLPGQTRNWDVSGDHGTFSYDNIYSGSGGSFDFRDFMDRDGMVLLYDVQSFEVVLTSNMHKENTVDYSHYATELNINPATLATSIPEPAMTPLVLSCAAAALLIRRRRATG